MLGNDIISRSRERVGDGSVKLENILGKLEKERLAAKSLKQELEQREEKLSQAETETYDMEKNITLCKII